MQGLDIDDIARVYGFGVAKSLSVWFQRYGRCVRCGNPGIVALLVEPSVFQMRKPKKKTRTEREDETDEEEEGDDDDDEASPVLVNGIDLRYRKKVEDGMRKWIEAECRRQTGNAYFNSPQCTTRMCDSNNFGTS
jgi:superfamily II DNA/RNA helicase